MRADQPACRARGSGAAVSEPATPPPPPPPQRARRWQRRRWRARGRTSSLLSMSCPGGNISATRTSGGSPLLLPALSSIRILSDLATSAALTPGDGSPDAVRGLVNGLGPGAHAKKRAACQSPAAAAARRAGGDGSAGSSVTPPSSSGGSSGERLPYCSARCCANVTTQRSASTSSREVKPRSAPAASKSRSGSRCPPAAAAMSGVQPSDVCGCCKSRQLLSTAALTSGGMARALGSAPAASSASTTAVWPSRQAVNRGVYPNTLCVSTTALASSSSRSSGSLPLCAAAASGVAPFSPTASTLARDASRSCTHGECPQRAA